MTGFRFAAKRRGGRFLFMLVALTVALWATTAAATVMVYFDLPTMIEESDVIVQGTVTAQTSGIDDMNQPYTITTMKVTRTFLGKPGKTLKFSQWGAPEPGGLKSRIPGDAQFEIGEESILFLVDGKAPHVGMHFLTALGQSKYAVMREGGDAFVFRDFTGVGFYDTDTQRIQPRGREAYELDAFIPELEALVAGIKGGEQ